ncbi:hypothetical protein BDZ94DRAFT_1313949 [Collybia nuda]|uniref:Uncharacterized protein n=1 Tax=Collybia nuda TaxID=64659 RepID=A0A9P5XW81_9AGAR|nr:hypothetical protein BDZ94DRAFT_1313949 [Collybia nuda]
MEGYKTLAPSSPNFLFLEENSLCRKLFWDLAVAPVKKDIEIASTWFSQCTGSKLGLIKVIIPHSHRVSSLVLPVDDILWESVSPNLFENLEYLSLREYEGDPRSGERSFSQPLNAPSLRSTKIQASLGTIRSGLSSQLPLSKLTKLRFTGSIIVTVLIPIFSACDSVIPMPHLHPLHIYSADSTSTPLPLLEVPNLLSLSTDIDLSSPTYTPLFQRYKYLCRITI